MQALEATLKLDEIRSERLRELYGYWRSKMRDGRLPARAAIEPTEIPRLLPYIMLIDVARDPLRLRVRLVGTQICAWAGRDVTGMYLDDPAYGPHGAEIVRQYAEVVARRRAMYSEQRAPRAERNFLFYERIALPLASDGETVDMLLCVEDVVAASPAMRAGKFRVMWSDFA